jgi:hypothetical protein
MINELDRENPPDFAQRWKESFQKTPTFKSYMQREKLLDPEIGFQKWKGDFRYRTAQGKKIERRQKDLGIIDKPFEHSTTQVAAAKVRQHLRQALMPKDPAGRPITRWEKQFVPEPKGQAIEMDPKVARGKRRGLFGIMGKKREIIRPPKDQDPKE